LKLFAFWGMIIPAVQSGLLGWIPIGLNVSFAVITAMILWFELRNSQLAENPIGTAACKPKKLMKSQQVGIK
jgi:hypothetical protein